MTSRVKYDDNTLASIEAWFRVAKPEPTSKDVCTQLGANFEEVGELVDALAVNDLLSNREISKLFYNAQSMERSKSGDEMPYQKDYKVQVLDALCDQIVTAVGVAYMMGFDIQKALAEVNRANWSKFEDGYPVLNEQGKIIKGRWYTAPQLGGYTGE